jgi:TolB protein
MGATYTDPQTGRSNFYADGSVDLTLPVAKCQVLAARGSVTEMYSTDIEVKRSKSNNLII